MTPYATMTPDQREVFLAALKGVVSNPKLMGSTNKVAASKAVELAETVAMEACPTPPPGEVTYVYYPNFPTPR